jgi:hypothetical protein
MIVVRLGLRSSIGRDDAGVERRVSAAMLLMASLLKGGERPAVYDANIQDL